MGSKICCKNEEDLSQEISYNTEEQNGKHKTLKDIHPTHLSEKKIYKEEITPIIENLDRITKINKDYSENYR